MNKHIILAALLILFVCEGKSQNTKQSSLPEVHAVGAMRQTMRNSELFGKVLLDTLSPKEILFAVGPVEQLSGEITVFEGVPYITYVESETMMRVEQTFGVKAPFMAYAHVEQWKAIPLPDEVRDLKSLEAYFLSTLTGKEAPFCFKIEAMVEEASIHIVNLPPGSVITSHEEAHQGKVNYPLHKQQVDLVGFYSTEHHGVYTHHDTNMHIHLVSKDRKMAGHLDAIRFIPQTLTLYLPDYE